MRGLLACAAVAASLTVSIPAARAGTNWPWCAVLLDTEGSATNCGFVSREQCEGYLSGIGGFCEPNPFYRARTPAPRPSR